MLCSILVSIQRSHLFSLSPQHPLLRPVAELSLKPPLIRALLAASATPSYREGASLVNTSCWQVRHLDSLGTGAAMAAMFAGV